MKQQHSGDPYNRISALLYPVLIFPDASGLIQAWGGSHPSGELTNQYYITCPSFSKQPIQLIYYMPSNTSPDAELFFSP